ncbi:MAG: serine--tRNA ligase, partial [Patescibacteria group bacterium]
MLDIKFVKDNKDKVKNATAAKQIDPIVVDKTLGFYEVWTNKLQLFENLRRERNKISESSKGYSSVGKELKDKLKKAELEIHEAYRNYIITAKDIPNPPEDDVKIGKDETENEILRKWGKIKKFEFVPKDHLSIGENLGIIDVQRASKVSGSRFAYLKGDATMLEFALISFAIKTLSQEGFVPITPPVLIKVPVFHNLGYSEHLGNENYYLVKGASESNIEEEPEYYLVGTAEHSIVPYYADEILSADGLPKRFVGFSSAFRRE